jgi:hypothetical protein
MFTVKMLWYKRQVKDWITWSPDDTATGECCVKLRFIDPEDDILEWTYWSWITLLLLQSKWLGSGI